MILSDAWAFQLATDAGTDVQFAATACDDDGTALTWRDVEHGESNGATPVDVVPAPSAGVHRVIRWVEIVNEGIVNRDVTVRLHNGSVERVARTWTLGPGASITYNYGEGWKILDSDGALRTQALQGDDGAVLYNNEGVTGAASLASIDAGRVALVSTDIVTPPAAGRVAMFGRSLAGRILPAVVGPSGRNTTLQPFLGRNRIAEWKPVGNAATLPLANGMVGPTTTGTAATRTVTTVNLLTSMRRLGYVSAATAGSVAGGRANANQLFRGDGTGGGFTLVMRWGVSDAAFVSGPRMFVGISALTTVPANVEPNVLVNCIGVCQLGTSPSNLHLVHNSTSGIATVVDLGGDFPASGLSADAYELIMFCNSGDLVSVRVERLNTGHVFEATPVTNVPATTQLMSPRLWRSNNATALAVGIDLVSLYIETDY